MYAIRSYYGIDDSQSVYLLKNLRNKNLSDEKLFNCLMCGKCQIDCPVGIETVNLRITQRIESTRQYNSSYNYLENQSVSKCDVVYFAGCMTHLVITSYSIHYTKLYEGLWQKARALQTLKPNRTLELKAFHHNRITSYNVCYTNLLRSLDL